MGLPLTWNRGTCGVRQQKQQRQQEQQQFASEQQLHKASFTVSAQ
jgi:hypothetical protein